MTSRYHVTEILVGPLPEDLTVIHGSEVDDMFTDIADIVHDRPPLDLDVSVSGRIATGVELHLEPGDDLKPATLKARDVLADRIEKWLGDDWHVYYYADQLLNDLDRVGLGVFPVDSDGEPITPTA